MKGEVNTEVDGALNTAIPGSPTADSINERVVAVDDLTQAAGGGDLAAMKAKTDNLASGIKKNTAREISFFMADSADGRTPKTGLTVAVQLSKDGAAFTNATNTPATEVGSGDYKIQLTQPELNFDEVILKGTATGADQTLLGIHTSDN